MSDTEPTPRTMNNQTNDGGPVFPGIDSIDAETSQTSDSGPFYYVNGKQGMSLRDAAALVALHALITKGEPEDYKHNAIVAYRNADAFIEARTTPPTTH